jgi:hypothetical protein
MMNLDDIRKDRTLVNDIDWDMTPEEAIVLYLEWGNNWSHGKMVKSKGDVSHYFIINSWDDPPKILFIRRDSQGADELAEFEMPNDLSERFQSNISNKKGVWGLTDEVREWLKSELN